jgi:cation-transporting ATPase 13A3/4/5
MEIELLNFSECTIQNSRSSEFLLSFEGPLTKGRVYQRYDFESALQRMSVVASISNGETYVFAKGSPEVMLSIARKGSIPSDYKEKLRHFTSSGFRVLAIASKPISEWKNQSRATIECDLEFNGF